MRRYAARSGFTDVNLILTNVTLLGELLSQPDGRLGTALCDAAPCDAVRHRVARLDTAQHAGSMHAAALAFARSGVKRQNAEQLFWQEC